MKSLLRDYDIDIGKGYPVQASATDLFKESRRNNLDMSQQVVLSDNQGPIKTATKHHNAIIEEAKRTVTKLLDEVRQLSNFLSTHLFQFQMVSRKKLPRYLLL